MPQKNEPSSFAARLRQLREAAGLSQNELERRANLGRSYVLRLERGENAPSLEVARRLALGQGSLACWD